MPKRLPRKLFLALVATALALAAAELALERWFPVRKLNLALDEELLYAPIPSTRKILPMPAEAGGERILVHVNARGFRGAELDEPKSRLRVAVFGDSLVMAENVRLEQTFVERLAVHLTESLGRPVETVNAGVSGYGPDQVLKRLERELPALDADLVVLVLCAHNDFGDLMRNKMFLLDDAGELVDSEYAIGPPLAAKFAGLERDSSELALVRLVRFFTDTRRAAEAPRGTDYPYINLYLHGQGGQGGLQDEYRSHVEDRDPLVYTALHDYYDADVALQPDWPSTVYKKRLLAALVARFREVCAAANVPLAGVVVPSAVDLDPNFQIRVDPVIWPEYDPRTLSDVQLTILTEAGVPALSLFDLFAANDPRTLFVSYRDVHWNARCQDLSAREVARYLEASELVGQ
ncbi:MAG: hypothetical protein GY711_07255 [bacterium]|nr:hypothetical protein [bacterium]